MTRRNRTHRQLPGGTTVFVCMRKLGLISAVALLVSVLSVARTSSIGLQEQGLQDGDFLVGVQTAGRGAIIRVRAGVAATFCESEGSPNNNPAVPGYFGTPKEVVIDSQGRVAFLGFMGPNAGAYSLGSYGLWRCDSMGAAPTLLGAFGGTQQQDDFGYRQPLGDRPIRFAAGLHIKRTVGLDLNNLAMVYHELYVFAVGDEPGLHHDTIAYDPMSGDWTRDLDDPVEDPGPGLDMINGDGFTFSVHQGKIRGVFEPISLEFQIGEFVGGVAFKSLRDFEDLVLDDKILANTPYDGCPPHLDDTPMNEPRNPAGTFNLMAGFHLLAWPDELVIASDSLGAGRAYLANVEKVLFDLIPENDKNSTYHIDPCAHRTSLGYTPWTGHAFNSFYDIHGTPRLVAQMTPDGTAGTQNAEGRIVRVGPGEEVEILAEGLVGPQFSNPTGIDVYPGFAPTTNGIALFVKIESPVNVLITAPDGRRIGADLDTGQPINDFGEAGYDSQTSEPHIYGIRDPLAGNLTIQTRGTGTGPYAITAYGANFSTGGISRVRFSGNAAPASESAHEFGLDEAGDVTSVGADSDGDGVPDATDNCPSAANPEQADQDADGSGDACDGDDDNDGVLDGSDNCPFVSNPQQEDTDADQIGDACDGDDDGDGVADAGDNCPFLANAGQLDTDSDGQGDACDDDDDGDGVADGSDAFPLNAAESVDTDGDGVGNNADTNDDNDGFADAADVCPLVAGPNSGCPAVGGGAGRMNGNGSIEVGGKEYDFHFKVDERVSGPESGTLRLVIRERRQGKDMIDLFTSTAVTAIMFSDNPAFQPGKKPPSGIDTVIFSGTGELNGMSGYSFEVECTDMGEPGKGMDTIRVMVKAFGTTVATAAGTLTKGNIQSKKAKK